MNKLIMFMTFILMSCTETAIHDPYAYTRSSNYHDRVYTCPHCHGIGRLGYEHVLRCAKCGGRGTIIRHIKIVYKHKHPRQVNIVVDRRIYNR